jgi:prepilin-type N-terminal cleavage/methylation domain-containing protein
MRNERLTCGGKAFTLIELLIVVAIIAILAAIAVPNFLEAQTRSKVSRVKADLRTYATALEAYKVDTNKYPYNHTFAVGGGTSRVDLNVLSTPVAYIASNQIQDPFNPDKLSNGTPVSFPPGFLYVNYSLTGSGAPPTIENVMDEYEVNMRPYATDGWGLLSWGPDRLQNSADRYYLEMKRNQGNDQATAMGRLYDPTNGTVSSGDLLRLGGGVSGVPATPN